MSRRKFIKLYDKFHEPIYRFIYFRVSSRETAEDLASEVFIKGFNYFKKIKPQNPRAVLYKITRNLIIDYYRRQRPEIKTEEPITEDKSYLDLQQALSKLKDSDRDIIVLYHFEGFSTAEVAGIMDKKESTIRAILHRARKKMQQFM